MSYYCPVDELTDRIVYMSTTYPKYRHRFPLLSWSYQNSESELLESLTQHNISARLVKGPYYDSYAEGDYDLIMETNCGQEPEVTYMTSVWDKDEEGSRSTIIISGPQCYFPMMRGPENLQKLNESLSSVPDEQIEILKKLYPKSWEKYHFQGRGTLSFSWEIPAH